jgi:hypothetical protein
VRVASPTLLSSLSRSESTESLMPSTARERARNPAGAAAQRSQPDPGPAPAEEVEGAYERCVSVRTRFGVDWRLSFRRSFHGTPLARSPSLFS